MKRKFMALLDHDNEEQQIQFLSGHRKHLLEKLHKDERQIDCLDYLLYQIQKRNKP